MPWSESAGDEQTIFQGKIFEIVKRPMKIGDMIIEFEIARRSPGVRLMIIRDDKMLLTREFCYERDGYSYRLPGGKVFDTLEEYNKTLDKDSDVMKHAKIAAKRECIEETGLIPKSINHLCTLDTGGSTIIWDLFYFLVDDFNENPEGQRLDIGEDITPEWKTFEEIKIMCMDEEINEERTVAVLLRFLERNSHNYKKGEDN